MKFEQPPINPKEQRPTGEQKQKFVPSPESIASLEDVQSVGIGWQGKLEVFLAACEIKPATQLSLFVLDSQDQIDIEKIFTDLGLHHIIAKEEATNPQDGDPQGIFLDYIVSHSESHLNRAKEAFLNLSRDGEDNEAVFGLAMGFPESAVHNFQQTRNRDDSETAHQELFLSSQEEKELLTAEESAFTFFRLSKAHWKEELAWVHDIIDATKKYAPKIYAGNMEEK